MLNPQIDTSWPSIRLETAPALELVPPEGIGETEAYLTVGALGHGWFDRASGTARLATNEPEDGRLVHPFLTAAAAIFSWWCERDAFHAGAFAVDGRAWGVIGDNEAGKSTLLAALAQRGVPVLADDLVAVEDGCTYPGPRCVDLRPSAAEALGLSQDDRVRGGTRVRVHLAPVEREVELAGWFVLGWGDRTQTTKLSGADRLRTLAQRRTFSLPPRKPEAQLALAALPTWRVTRRRSWEALDESADAMLELAAR